MPFAVNENLNLSTDFFKTWIKTFDKNDCRSRKKDGAFNELASFQNFFYGIEDDLRSCTPQFLTKNLQSKCTWPLKTKSLRPVINI